MGKIINIKARQILDSRGNPTVEADVYTDSNIVGRASVPSGASTGKYEAVELRDKDKNRYFGKGVLKAVDNINNIISNKIKGVKINDQNLIDDMMISLDGTPNKSNLGANAMLAVSLACAKASALEQGNYLFNSIGVKRSKQLPIPMMNILNGGAHADNSIDFQEFMIMPLWADSFSEALRMGTEVFQTLKIELKNKGYSTNVGDEGGFAPNLKSNEQAIEIIIKSIEKAGYNVLGVDINEEFHLTYNQKKLHPWIKADWITGQQLYQVGETILKQQSLLFNEDLCLIDARPENYWLAKTKGVLVDLGSIKPLNRQSFWLASTS